MRFSFIESLSGRHPLAPVCRLLGVSRQGYHAWLGRPRSRREREDDSLKKKIARIWERSHRTYGSPRVWAELKAGHGVSCSRKRVERLMRELGLKGKDRRWRRRSLTRRDRRRRPSPDLVGRRFRADRPDRLWLADISQVRTSEGWLYLAAVLDQSSRRVVGWSMREDLAAGIVIDALSMAVGSRQPPPGLIHHSDQGSQYTSLGFGKALSESGLLGSMGRTGSALDNAPIESFFATLKSELIRDRVYPTRNAARMEIFGYIEGFYNRTRRHSALGYLSPDEYEKSRRLGKEKRKAA